MIVPIHMHPSIIEVLDIFFLTVFAIVSATKRAVLDLHVCVERCSKFFFIDESFSLSFYTSVKG